MVEVNEDKAYFIHLQLAERVGKFVKCLSSTEQCFLHAQVNKALVETIRIIIEVREKKG